MNTSNDAGRSTSRATTVRPIDRPIPPISDADLTAALVDANLPALLMVLFQLTGDHSWLRGNFKPVRTRGVSENTSGGFTPEIQSEIRAAARREIHRWAVGQSPAVPSPTGPMLVEMMSACMGEQVPDEYAPFVAEELGFVAAEDPAAVSSDVDFSVAIIGAGLSGLLVALRLKEAGIPCVVFEKNDSIGGTWYENRYPGCGVDTPSYLYSFSFYPRRWSTRFARGPEVETYLADFAQEHGLLEAVRFRTEVVAADYNEDRSTWTIQVREAGGELRNHETNAVVTAVGQLNRPKIPADIAIENFGGRITHSAQWPEGFEVDGQRVAVVGTGASAMQVVPAIVGRVAHLDVFQRSPQWISPVENYFARITPEMHWLFDNVPFYREWYRFRLFWSFSDKVHQALQVDPEWKDSTNSISAENDAHRRYLERYIRDSLEGFDELLANAIPDYPPFGKRMLLDNGWYAAMRQDNVDLHPVGVKGFTSTGVVGDDGIERPADVVILATGFEASRMLFPMEIRGRSGQTTREVWGEDDAQAYLGITASGFPNLFFTYGPNTTLGHGGSFIAIAECQARYIAEALQAMVDGDIAALECKAEICEAYNRRVDEAHSTMVWSHKGFTTWYRNAAGRVLTSPWRVVDYWKMTRSVSLDDFIVTRVGRRDRTAAKRRASHAEPAEATGSARGRTPP